MSSYGASIQRSSGSDPLVQEPTSARKKRSMATPDAATLRKLQKQGKAMPPTSAGGTPRFPIANADDLANAIKAVGRVKPATEAARSKVRKYIIGRAKALGLSSKIPDTWNSDGSLKGGSDSGSSGGKPAFPGAAKPFGSK